MICTAELPQSCRVGTVCKTPSKKYKGDSRYTGSDNEDDFNDFSMGFNKGSIQYDL